MLHIFIQLTFLIFTVSFAGRKGKQGRIKGASPRKRPASTVSDDDTAETQSQQKTETPSKRRLRSDTANVQSVDTGVLPEPLSTGYNRRITRKHSFAALAALNTDGTSDDTESVLNRPSSEEPKRRTKKQKRTHDPSATPAQPDTPSAVADPSDIPSDGMVVDESPSIASVNNLLNDELTYPESDLSSLFGSEGKAYEKEYSPEIPVLKDMHVPAEKLQSGQKSSLNGTPTGPPPGIPAHRWRAANPRVKLIDDSLTHGDLDKAIEAAMSRPTTLSGVTNASVPLSPSPSTTSQARSSRSTRSYGKRDATLMVFKKGELVSLPRSSKSVSVERDEMETPTQQNSFFNDLDNDLSNLDVFDITREPPAGAAAFVFPSLLELSGLDPADADALDDYDEDAHGEDDPDHVQQPIPEQYVVMIMRELHYP